MTPVGLLFKVNSEGLFTCPVNASPVDYAKSTKAVNMTKDETMLLVQLVAASHAVIVNKATTATYNKMKEDAWQTLTVDFNSSVSSSRRTTAQVRLKWENLKKAARKRCADMSHNKTGGGKDYFPPDEILDKVASLLDVTHQGLSTEFGGDATEKDFNLLTDEVENVEVIVPGAGGVDEREVLKETEQKQNSKHKFNKETQTNNTYKQILDTPPPKQKRFILSRASRSGILAKRKRKMEVEKYKACIFRENALAEYLIARKRKIELENEEKEINIAKLKLELENARLQNVKLEKVLNLIG